MAEQTRAAGTEPLLLATFAWYRTTGASAWIKVNGGSMTPLIQAGDEVYVEFGPRRPRLGEIVVFPEHDEMVVHRLVRRQRAGSGELLRTRGDGRLAFDRPFPADQVFGIVRACRRAGVPVQVVTGGRRATTMALASLSMGIVIAAAERLPVALRAPLTPVASRLGAATVWRVARTAAWCERVAARPPPST
jgi:signal peptidase I